jgi:hypothetical protein
MKRANLSRQRLAALGLLGIPLLTYPLFGLALGQWGGWPAGYVYLFGIWAGLIGVAAWVAERKGR